MLDLKAFSSEVAELPLHLKISCGLPFMAAMETRQINMADSGVIMDLIGLRVSYMYEESFDVLCSTVKGTHFAPDEHIH